MIISYTYRGVKTVLSEKFTRVNCTEKGEVKFETCCWNNNIKIFTVTVQPHELLNTAVNCLDQLNKIANTNYKVFNDVQRT